MLPPVLKHCSPTPAVSRTLPLGASSGNNQTGFGNIAIGANADSAVMSGSNNIDIANTGANESGTIRIGGSNQTNTYIAGINGVTVAGGIGVIVDSNGHLGTITSSARFKEEIKPMDKSSEAIFALKPVTFRYKHELDPDGIPQFGLVAEQVEKVDPDLVVRDDKASLTRSVRSSERDVAQRVPQRASQGRIARANHGGATEANQSFDRKSARDKRSGSNSTIQTCANSDGERIPRNIKPLT